VTRGGLFARDAKSSKGGAVRLSCFPPDFLASRLPLSSHQATPRYSPPARLNLYNSPSPALLRACISHAELSLTSTGRMSSLWSSVWEEKAVGYTPIRRDSLPDSPDVRTSSWQHKRRSLIVYLLALVVGALATAGAISSTLALSGQIKLVPHYTKAQLLDAGWLRPPLALEKWAPASAVSDERPLGRLSTHDFTLPPTTSTTALNLLILTPLHNAADRLPNYFSKLDAFTHPRINTSLGFIVSDSTDDTGDVLRKMVDERRENYNEVTLLQKDFNIENPGGKSRHQLWAQGQRR
jgi:hypothetical protein